MSGVVIYKNESAVVRAEWRNGELVVNVHNVVNGKEELPRGYMLGSNCVVFKPKNPYEPPTKEALEKKFGPGLIRREI